MLQGISNASSNLYSSQITSGRRITNASVDPSGMAIAEKLDNQASSNQVAANNARSANDLLKVSDGALGSISDSLSRIRELSLQSQNGTYTDSDRQIFQNEIDDNLEFINDVVGQTQFNGRNLIDGSFDGSFAVGANGQSVDFKIGSAGTDALGMTGFNITGGDIDLTTIDNAIDAVMSLRAESGATSNRLEYSARVADNNAYNQEVARSRMEDTDIAQASMKKASEDTRQDAELLMLRKQMDMMGMHTKLFA